MSNKPWYLLKTLLSLCCSFPSKLHVSVVAGREENVVALVSYILSVPVDALTLGEGRISEKQLGNQAEHERSLMRLLARRRGRGQDPSGQRWGRDAIGLSQRGPGSEPGFAAQPGL